MENFEHPQDNRDFVSPSENETAVTLEQIQVTPKIREIAAGLHGQGESAIHAIHDYIQTIEPIAADDPKRNEPDFSRTADQIIQEQNINGCNEAGVVYAALLKAKGIPSRYIQALRKDAVKSYTADNQTVNGHVFLEVDLDGKKRVINSTTGEMTDELPDDYIVGAQGQDAWSIGLKHGLEDLQKLFENSPTARP